VFSGTFVAADVDAVGEKGSGVTTMIDVQTPLEAFFEHIPENLPVSMTKFFSIREQNFWSRDYFPHVPEYQDFQIIRCWINRILPHMVSIKINTIISTTISYTNLV